MARAQDGDREAYRTLLTEVEPYVRSIAVKYLGSSSDLEDAVQDVLMTVHSIRQTYDPKRPFGPWLVAIAHRRIIDQLRRQLRRRSRETELSTEHETLLHNLDATIMILIWNLSTAALIAGMASALGRPLLAWVAGHVMPLLPPQLSSK
jgi:RNA polymerase sigma factor (sigma-70 family)